MKQLIRFFRTVFGIKTQAELKAENELVAWMHDNGLGA